MAALRGPFSWRQRCGPHAGHCAGITPREPIKPIRHEPVLIHEYLAEYPLKTHAKTNIAVDGALLHHIRTPLGWWEAKDEDDDLDAEIAAKFRRGYPRDNIVFTDDVTASLWQAGNEVMRCSMTDTTLLEKLLKLFFGFERPEIAGFRRAVEQFKTDLPAVLKGLRDMIEAQHQRNAAFRTAQDAFLLHAQEAINPGLVPLRLVSMPRISNSRH